MSGEDRQDQEPVPGQTPSAEAPAPTESQEVDVMKMMEEMAEAHLGKSHPEMLKVRKGTASLMKEVNAFIEKRAKELGLSVSVNDYMGKVVNFSSSEESQEKAEGKEAKRNSISITTLTLALADAENHVADVYAKGFGHVIHELNSHTLKVAD